MKRIFIFAAVLTSMIGTFGLVGRAAPPVRRYQAVQAVQPPSSIKWQTDLKAARKQAVTEGKPIMIVFGAEWCGFCKKLEHQTLNTPEMSRYINDNFIPVHLDLDKEKKIGSILEVESLPCTVVLSPDADLLGRINGYQTVGPYQKNLAAARQLYRPAQSVVPTQGVLR